MLWPLISESAREGREEEKVTRAIRGGLEIFGGVIPDFNEPGQSVDPMFQGSGSRSPAMATTAAAAASVLNASTDSNPDDDPNNSIIRKVRSRVSSIIPDALSKWFSPSAVKRPREMAESSSSPPPVAVAGRNGNLLRQLEEQHQQEAEGEEDEDEAPPTRKKKRVEERFNTSLGDFNDDLSALPGPSGLNISAIDRRSSLPMSATVPRGRSAFSSSTPSTSPQQQHQPSSQGGLFQRQQLQQRISHANRATVPYNFGAATAADPIVDLGHLFVD